MCPNILNESESDEFDGKTIKHTRHVVTLDRRVGDVQSVKIFFI